MKLKQYLTEATIKGTAIALAKKGYTLGKSKHDKKWNISYQVTQIEDGSTTWLTPKEIAALVK